MVIYFSGTGNSRYVAKKIAEISGDEIISINHRLKDDDYSPVNQTGHLFSSARFTQADCLASWGNNCTHCMACIAGCPSEAIEYGKKTQDKPRYYLGEK